MNFKILLVLVLCVYYINCENEDKCNFNTCGECISSAHGICVWCSMDVVQGRRCKPITEVNSTKMWCNGDYINPKFERKVIVNNEFNSSIQLRPQRIKIKTRPGLEIPFQIYFKPAKDYPLDVYYLIDISYTMKEKKDELQKQAQEIYKQLNSYTNNVQLGIGSFVEKPGFPLVDKYKSDDVPISHAFKNHLALTKDVDRFKAIMAKISFGGNYDDPEAGLDGLMQAMVCIPELKWRKEARRIIVMCTDSTYHSAGDGIIVGAIKPNDMKCHLENDLYNETLALTYDYPSISQINKIASEGNFKIVFATKKTVKEEYTLLANQILGAKYAVLEGGEDALKIIKAAYLEYSRKANIYFALPPFIQLTLDQNCTIGRNCESKPEKRTVKIEGTLLVKQCPPDNKMKHELSLKVIGIPDTITIELEIDCQCDCEKENSRVTNSDKCHAAGFIQCGICKCNPGNYGVDCRCNGTSSDTIDMETCKLNAEDKKLCSGRGTCRCGKCEECNKGFSGQFCQFDDTACRRKNKMLCSNNGVCTWGQCVCNPLWSGLDCGCSLDNSGCFTPYSKELCSGHGHCECGECKCDNLPDKEGKYGGRYCDICDDCGEKRCKDLEEYVLCNFIANKTHCDELYKTPDTLVYFLNATQLNGPDWITAQYCKKRLENDSCIIFKYTYDNDYMLKLGIQKELEPAPEANIFIAVGASLGAVLLIGILTLIVWKILIDMHDKKEYEKFVKESNAKGDKVYLNDTYQPAASTFRNPAFISS